MDTQAKLGGPVASKSENQKLKIKMQNDKSKFKDQFKKRLYNFALKLIEFLDKLPKDNVSKRVGDQLLRSGTGIIGNYVEGLAASSKKDFINFFNNCLKSTNESKLWFALLRDSKRAKPEEVRWFLNELDEYSKIFASSILTLKGKK
jgi:four helix bundle protein